MSIMIIYSHVLIRKSESSFFQNLHPTLVHKSLSIFISTTFEFQKVFPCFSINSSHSKTFKRHSFSLTSTSTKTQLSIEKQALDVLALSFFNHLPQNMTLYSHTFPSHPTGPAQPVTNTSYLCTNTSSLTGLRNPFFSFLLGSLPGSGDPITSTGQWQAPAFPACSLMSPAAGRSFQVPRGPTSVCLHEERHAFLKEGAHTV